MTVWETALQSVTNSIGESVTYKGTGLLTEEIKAVFSDIAGMRDLTTFQKIIDQEPHILIQLDDLTQEPAQDDIFEVRSTEFYVAYLEKDGEGGAKVFLREKLD